MVRTRRFGQQRLSRRFRRRLRFLIADRFRLRCLVNAFETQFCHVTPGRYLFYDDGELEGPWEAIETVAHRSALQGQGGVMITVERRFGAFHIP